MTAALASTSSRQTGRVRPLLETDIPAIAELHDNVTHRAAGGHAQSTREHFTRIFLQHPWRNAAMPSLVYETSDGKIAGCVGVMPRTLVFNNRTITAAVTHNFIVAPEQRSSMAALMLARQVLAGPQELSLAEGNELSRRIWESFHGSASLLYSLHWTRPLHPGQYLLGFLRKRGLPAPAALLLQPFAQLADLVLPRMLDRNAGTTLAGCTGEALDAAALCHCLTHIPRGRTLRPLPDQQQCEWLLGALHSRANAELHKVLVRGGNGDILGWYVYYTETSGSAGNVVQVWAGNDVDRTLVLNHLFHHARQRGVSALSGQLDPVLMRALARKSCAFHHDGRSWLLVHSRHPEILQSINAGEAFLSRLEGEWWINYING